MKPRPRPPRGLPLVALVAIGHVLAPARSAAAQEIEVRVDPRVELFGVLFQMGGRDEYRLTRVPRWQQAVHDWFDGSSDHPAVVMTRRLAGKYNVGYFVPMNLAVHVTDPPALAERIPFDRSTTIHRTWTTFPDTTSSYLDLVRDFARDADFAGFMASSAALVDSTESRLRDLIARRVDAAWIQRFWGESAAARFILVPGLLNGGASYGVEYQPEDGEREIYAITGVRGVDADGFPAFEDEFARVVVHELDHAYANALIDAHRDELAAIGDALYGPVADRMRSQAYGSWESMMYESLVRAAVIRYVAAHEGETAAAEVIAEQTDLGFEWSGALDELLREYEADRARYPSVRAFMPRIVELFQGWATRSE